MMWRKLKDPFIVIIHVSARYCKQFSVFKERAGILNHNYFKSMEVIPNTVGSVSKSVLV